MQEESFITLYLGTMSTQYMRICRRDIDNKAYMTPSESFTCVTIYLLFILQGEMASKLRHKENDIITRLNQIYHTSDKHINSLSHMYIV